MPLLLVRRFADVEGGAFPCPALNEIIVFPVIEDIGKFEFQGFTVYPGFRR